MDTLQPFADGKVKLAEEEGLGRYYAGIARIAGEGVDLHADWAPLNSPTYDIANVDAQLGWNFYAEELVSGGETTVHNAPWNPECAPGEIPKSYGLDYSVVEGRSAEHTSELQSLMRISYAVFCLKKKNQDSQR